MVTLFNGLSVNWYFGNIIENAPPAIIYPSHGIKAQGSSVCLLYWLYSAIIFQLRDGPSSLILARRTHHRSVVGLAWHF